MLGGRGIFRFLVLPHEAINRRSLRDVAEVVPANPIEEISWSLAGGASGNMS
ncbi:MAG: hypothetical protein AB7H80_01575 [Candidatus Kapaibacterium sp.]